MSFFRVEITGVKEVDKALHQLEPTVRKKVVRSAMKASLKPVRAVAQAAAPVGKTGKLRDNIKVKAAKRSRKAITYSVMVGDKDFEGEAWYGAAVELGTARQPAQGFLKKAYEEKNEQVKDACISEILKGIEKIAARGGK